MNINLRDVTIENWYQCANLSVSDEQKTIFSFPVVFWIAESKFVESFQLLAIYNNDTLVGFSVYGFDKEDNHYWIVAFMIDRNHQQKGYGKEAVKKIIERLKEKHGCKAIKLGHRHNNSVAARLYESLGFKEIGKDEHEIIRCLNIEELQQAKNGSQ